MSIDKRLDEIQGDERKIRQVVLNLLSNAIKFTPEGGRIEVAAIPKNGFVQVSVSAVQRVYSLSPNRVLISIPPLFEWSPAGQLEVELSSRDGRCLKSRW